MPWSRDVPARDRVESEDHQRRSHPADWLCRACRRLPDVSCALSSVEPQGMIAPIVGRWMRRPAIGDSKSRFSPVVSAATGTVSGVTAPADRSPVTLGRRGNDQSASGRTIRSALGSSNLTRVCMPVIHSFADQHRDEDSSVGEVATLNGP